MTTETRNGTFPTDGRSAAELYLAMGLAPIPLPPRSKDPGYTGWQDLRLTADALDDHFPFQLSRNVGILNGAPSNNALDVDLDCPQALDAAPLLRPFAAERMRAYPVGLWVNDPRHDDARCLEPAA